MGFVSEVALQRTGFGRRLEEPGMSVAKVVIEAGRTRYVVVDGHVWQLKACRVSSRRTTACSMCSKMCVDSTALAVESSLEKHDRLSQRPETAYTRRSRQACIHAWRVSSAAETRRDLSKFITANLAPSLRVALSMRAEASCVR